MTRYLHQFEHARAVLGAIRQEAGSQAVTAELGRIEAGALGVHLDDVQHAAIGHGLHSAALGDRTEDWPVRDAASVQPCPEGLHGASPVAVRDGDLLPLPFLIPLAVPDQHANTVRRL